ncbi:MAG: cell division protein FtsQ/DivIB [Alkalispirochaeta sp.]
MAEAALHRRPRRSVAPSPGSRFLVILAVVFSVILAGYVLAVTVVLPWLRISRVVVQADFDIDRQALLDLAGLEGTRYYFGVHPDRVISRLEEHPLIRSAAVERKFPNTVRLELLRRRALATAVMNSEGRSIPVAVDETGMIYDRGAHLADRNVPVLSGLGFEGDVVGSTLPSGMEPLLQSLYDLRVSSPEIYRLISELRIQSRGTSGFDVLMYTEEFRVPVRFGTTIDKDACTYALMVLDVLTQRGEAADIAEVDFRSGEIVYRMKEDVSGR